MTDERPDPDPLHVPDLGDTPTYYPDRSGAVFVYAVGAVCMVMAVIVAALALGWRP